MVSRNGHGGPRRRHDDIKAEIDADEVEEFFGSLPKVIDGLRRGRWQNRIIAGGAVVLAFWLSNADDQQRAELAESQRMDRARAEKICEDLTENARKFNRLVDTLIKRTKASPVIPAKDKAEAVRLYVSARQTLPVCVPPLHK
jgi:hypothetical protein